MTLERDQVFRGLVLNSYSYHDNDQMVKVFTDKFGIRTFLVRGTKKANSKNRYLTLPFTYGTYLGIINDRGFSYFNGAKKIEQFSKISSDIELNAYVTYINDLVVRTFPEEESQSNWFEKLLSATKLIDSGLDPEIITNIMEIQLLQPLGVEPNFRSCVIGGETKGTFDYSLILSGILCSKHWEHDLHRLHLMPKVVSYMRLFSRIHFSQIGKIDVSEQVKAQLRSTIDMIYHDSVGIYPKSKKFIDQMYRWRL